MHFISGGSHQGKGAWVKETYHIEQEHPSHWISIYQGEKLPSNIATGDIMVLEHVEEWVYTAVKNMEADVFRSHAKEVIQSWLAWEKINQCHLIIIGSDISKGIVPMDPLERKWRDATGWFYQDLAKAAERVEIIWYGIARKIK